MNSSPITHYVTSFIFLWNIRDRTFSLDATIPGALNPKMRLWRSLMWKTRKERSVKVITKLNTTVYIGNKIWKDINPCHAFLQSYSSFHNIRILADNVCRTREIFWAKWYSWGKKAATADSLCLNLCFSQIKFQGCHGFSLCFSEMYQLV